jgi:large subunit ribosomal protein L22
MAKVNYTLGPEADPETTARAMAYELHISPKHAHEVIKAIKGKKVEDAETFLENVLDMKVAVPYKRYKKKVPHRRGLKNWDAGRYPVRATAEILKVLKSARSNAEYKGLDTEALRVWRVATKQGRTIHGILPRAFGRATPFNTETVTVEIILKEIGS